MTVIFTTDAISSRVQVLADEINKLIRQLPAGEEFRAGRIRSNAAAHIIGVTHTDGFTKEYFQFEERL